MLSAVGCLEKVCALKHFDEKRKFGKAPARLCLCDWTSWVPGSGSHGTGRTAFCNPWVNIEEWGNTFLQSGSAEKRASAKSSPASVCVNEQCLWPEEACPPVPQLSAAKAKKESWAGKAVCEMISLPSIRRPDGGMGGGLLKRFSG
jgi:hypothetical protein